MADNNKVFLGTNKDTYIAADDAGNIVMQHEAGNRVEVTSDSLKSNSIQLGNTKILTDETGALVSSIDGGENQPLGGGGDAPLSYQFSTALSTVGLDTAIVTSPQGSQMGYLNFNTQEIEPGNGIGYFTGASISSSLFKDVARPNTINLTSLWAENIGRNLTPSDAGDGAGATYYTAGSLGDFDIYLNDRYGLDENTSNFSPASISFDFEYNITSTTRFNQKGQSVKGAINLYYTQAIDAADYSIMGYLWQPYLSSYNIAAGNYMSIKGFGDIISPDEWITYSQSDKEIYRLDETIVDSVRVWSPSVLLDSLGGNSSFSVLGAPPRQLYQLPLSLREAATDLDGNLNNIVDFRALQYSSQFGGGTDRYSCALKYDLKLDNFKFSAGGNS